MKSQTPLPRGTSLQSCPAKSTRQPHRKLVGQKPISFGCSYPTTIPEKRELIRQWELALCLGISFRAKPRGNINSVPICCEPRGASSSGPASFCILQTAGGSHPCLEQSGRASKRIQLLLFRNVRWIPGGPGGRFSDASVAHVHKTARLLVCVRRAPSTKCTIS